MFSEFCSYLYGILTTLGSRALCSFQLPEVETFLGL